MDLPIENVQSYPRPPVVEAVQKRIRILFAGLTIVDTTRAFRVLETHHPPTYYIPSDDTNCVLRPTSRRTLCEWKGTAEYYDVIAGEKTALSAAWCYGRSTAPYALIVGYFAFYADKMDKCFVGNAAADPQAGSFYGGWLTPNLTGSPKGPPGTEFW